MANRLTTFGRWLTQGFTRGLAGMTAEEHIGVRTAARSENTVTHDTALRSSGVWACLRLRADLVSTFPLDVFRRFENQRLEVPTPRVLVQPAERWDYQDWMYATQFDLDRSGNAFGLVTARDGAGRPAQIEPLALSDVRVVERKETGQLIYRVRNEEYIPEQIWHERQFVVAGLPVGLSPVAHAAWLISEAMSIQQFAESWFGRGAVPSAQLRNSKQTVPPKIAAETKARFLASVKVGDPFVTGNDWEYSPLQAQEMGMEWLEARQAGLTDLSRFFGVPADLIDAAVKGQSITYANISERNLQFLIMHLGPAVRRREKNLSKLTAAPRFVKLNTDALLAMDPKAQNEAFAVAIEGRWMTNSEVRALKDRPPLTPAQIDEFATIYGPPRTQPTTAVS